ncbi:MULTISPECIES: hypothetical protein [unclassified Spirosoma]|uniref:hypothetical protein n=1 Tax=unclassified Spirosoma TaxID=2621999 RepID=UPI000959033B|nr:MULTISPECIES: hypothetical protein [unclassified Spirosoma]MBN8823259.1 hypothetical protein [Spirosoma sp.]OJW72593.1 MAG: hypothetical protein BGO59_15865 [Spirosoma sp. 48-14]
MFTHEDASELLDSTMTVLESESGSTTPQDGSPIIDQWLTQLHQADNAGPIAQTLEQVKEQLQMDSINSDELCRLLNTLATQTSEFSTMMGSEGDMATRLEALSAGLKLLAGQVNHA